MSGQIILTDSPDDPTVTITVSVDEFGAQQRVSRGLTHFRLEALPVAGIIILSGKPGGGPFPPSYSLQATELTTTTDFVDIETLRGIPAGAIVVPGLRLNRKPDDGKPFALDAVGVTL
jgi:hypothetical protein